jgi:hypothetical protein
MLERTVTAIRKKPARTFGMAVLIGCKLLYVGGR